MTYRNF